MPDPQQVLDATGQCTVQGELFPTAPLYLTTGMALRGDGNRGTKLNTFYSGSGAIAGTRRGLISEDHWIPSGFRTLGDCFLLGRGTGWDLGPPGGWQTVSTLRIQFRATKNFTGPWHQPLCGMQTSEPPTASHPSPFTLSIYNGLVHLDVKLADGTQHEKTWTADVNATTIDIDVTVNLETEYGVGSRLAPNTLWPFGVGRCPPYGNDTGYWGTFGEGNPQHDPPDITIEKLIVYTNGTLHGQLWPQNRVPTYTGGSSLPLVVASSRGTRHLNIIHRSMGELDTVKDVRIENLEITGAVGCPTIDLTGALGDFGLLIEKVKIAGGSRAVQTSGVFTAYPITVRDAVLAHQTDTPFWFERASGVTLDRARTDYSGRCCGEFVSCNGWVRGELMMARPDPAQEAIFIQHGGDMRYDRMISNYEWPPYPQAFLKLHPVDYYEVSFPTKASVNQCRVGSGAGMSPAVAFGPRPSWYTAPCTVTVDNATIPIPV